MGFAVFLKRQIFIWTYRKLIWIILKPVIDSINLIQEIAGSLWIFQFAKQVSCQTVNMLIGFFSDYQIITHTFPSLLRVHDVHFSSCRL